MQDPQKFKQDPIGDLIGSLIFLAILIAATLLFHFMSESILADHLAKEGPASADGNFYGYGFSYLFVRLFGIGSGIATIISLVLAVRVIRSRRSRGSR